MMTANDTRTALVTGATGGIGYELCKLFAEDGYALVINARHEQDLNDVAHDLEATFGVSVTIIARDLSEPNAPDEIFSRLQEQSIKVDALVNNAGFNLRKPFAEADLETQLAMIRVNSLALTHLTKLFLDEMVERGDGRILNVSSTAAFFPGPLEAVYYATKAYVLSFSQAIAHELEGTGVTVTALCPGPTDTEFHERANQTSTWLLYLLGRMDPETVARAGYRGMMRGRHLVVPSFQDKLILFFRRFGPRSLWASILQRLHRRRGDGT